MHQYDRHCSCKECNSYERQLDVKVQADRASDREREKRNREAQIVNA